MEHTEKIKTLARNHRVEIITFATVLPIVLVVLAWNSQRHGGWPASMFGAAIRHKETEAVLATGPTPRDALESTIADLRRRWIRHILQAGPGAPRTAPDETEADLKKAMESAFAGASIDKLELPGVDLRGGHLRGVSAVRANLSGAQCAFTHFESGDFSGANLSGADFSEAVLTSATFRGVDFKNANLAGADLSNSLIAGCNFSGADLTNTKFDGAEMHGVTWDSNTKFTGADLSGVRFLSEEARKIAAEGGARVPDPAALPAAVPTSASAAAES